MAGRHILMQGLFYGAAATGYLFLFMIFFSPRIWGYKDYPDVVKRKVPLQTRKEKAIGAIVGLPWFVFILGFPVYSAFALKAKLGGDISFATAFLNCFAMFLSVTIGDLVLLDWLVISRITPKFVIIPGTVKEDYKDFTHHYIGHAKAAIPLIAIALLIAGIASWT